MTTNTWDFENRLTNVALPAGVLNTFGYNGDGIRVQRQDSSGTTKQIWVDQKILEETDQNNTVQVVYTQSLGPFGDLVSQRRSGATSYFAFDPLGATTRLTDGGQNVIDTYLYKAFGDLLLSSGTTENIFQFIARYGYLQLVDLGFYAAGARVTNPLIGRWLTLDPLGRSLNDANGYMYVANRPVIFVDPSGLAIATMDADSFIPWKWVSVPPLSIGNVGPLWQPWTSEVEGNDRGVSKTPLRNKLKSKTYDWLDADLCKCRTSKNALIAKGSGIGPSERRDWNPWLGYWYSFGTGTFSHSEWARTSCGCGFEQPPSCYTVAHIDASGRVPVAIAPMPASINYSYTATFCQIGTAVYWSVNGWHDGFPAHEFYLRVNGSMVMFHSFVPPYPNWISGAARLLGIYDQQTVSGSGVAYVTDSCPCCRENGM